MLWWYAKCLHDNNLKDHYILPSTGYDFQLRYVPYKEMSTIIEIVKKQFPKANILPHHSYDFMSDPRIDQHKSKIIREKRFKDLIDTNKIEIYINATTESPPIEDGDFGGITRNRNNEIFISDNISKNSALKNVNKKFLEYQYKKYNLMNSLYPLTHSCINPDYYGNPCKYCDWCREKYWAFGMYDRKQQKSDNYFAERVLKYA